MPDAVASSRKSPQPVAPPPDTILLRKEHVAYLLDVSVETVMAMKAAGKIPVADLPARRLRFSRKEIEEWIRRGCPKPQRK